MGAFQGNTVPIYWGTSDITKIFNPDAFYYLNDKFEDENNPTDEELDAVVIELRALANNDSETGWRKFLRHPIYKDNRYPTLFKLGDRGDKQLNVLAKTLRERYDTHVSRAGTASNDLRGDPVLISYDDSGAGIDFKKKYLKYKNKYLQLKNNLKR